MLMLKNKKYLVSIIIILVAGSCLLLYNLKNGQELTSNTVVEELDTNTTSDVASAQSDFSGADSREAGNSLPENQGTGIISDTGGTPAINTSNPIISGTGEITVYSPGNDSNLSSNPNLYGESTLSVVSYRIIDTVSGVIATGELKVVDGKFSGNVSFSTSSAKGRIDLYGTRPDATEFSNIEIPVSFK